LEAGFFKEFCLTDVLILLICRWLLRRGCTGSRNFLDAFRKAVENEEEKAHGIGK